MVIFLKIFIQTDFRQKQTIDEFCHWREPCNWPVALSLVGVFNWFSHGYYYSPFPVFKHDCITQCGADQLTEVIISLFSDLLSWIGATLSSPSAMLFFFSSAAPQISSIKSRRSFWLRQGIKKRFRFLHFGWWSFIKWCHQPIFWICAAAIFYQVDNFFLKLITTIFLKVFDLNIPTGLARFTFSSNFFKDRDLKSRCKLRRQLFFQSKLFLNSRRHNFCWIVGPGFFVDRAETSTLIKCSDRAPRNLFPLFCVLEQNLNLFRAIKCFPKSSRSSTEHIICPTTQSFPLSHHCL